MPIPVISAIAAAAAPTMSTVLPALGTAAMSVPTVAYLVDHAEDIKPYANRILTSLRDDVASIIKPTTIPLTKAQYDAIQSDKSKSQSKGDIQYRTLPYEEVISRTTPPSGRVQIDLSRTMDSRLLNSSEPLSTAEWVWPDPSTLGSPAPNDPKNNQGKKKNPFKRGWEQAQNNSPEKWHNSWSSLVEKIGYGANKFWQFETSPLGVLSNMFLIGSGTGAYFGLKDNNETSEPVQKTNTPREEDYLNLREQFERAKNPSNKYRFPKKQ